ncbi:hypothetical protein ABZP36_019921 [Zizania latifolia]
MGPEPRGGECCSGSASPATSSGHRSTGTPPRLSTALQVPASLVTVTAMLSHCSPFPKIVPSNSRTLRAMHPMKKQRRVSHSYS